MMFDPPDFPYKELTETLGDNYCPDDLFFNNDAMVPDPITNDRDLVKVTEAMISTVENQLSYNSNISGKLFNVEAVSTLNAGQTNEQNLELYVVQSENLFNYEPTLLDDNTVNQFLLPIQESSDTNKAIENGPDLLALHSCVVCHEIFTTDAELLDHTVLAHATDPSLEPEQSPSTPTVVNTYSQESSFECEWLVCRICERVLSTALEPELRDIVCCVETNDRSNLGLRKLATMFVCDYCSYLFANGEALDRHRLTCYGHEDYPFQMDNPVLESTPQYVSEYPCSTCGKHCVNEEELRTHTMQCPPPRKRRPYSTGNSNKMWNCGSCNQLFATARELYRHKRGEDRPPGTPLMAYVCEECDKVLGSMCALHTHKKMHKVSKPGYPCRVCGRRFNQSGHLAIHMRMHTGERPYPCDLCDKAFKVKVERDDHRRTHTGERPFACSACSKTFTAAARLREHARIHTDQRPYKCDICGAAFRRPYARTVHTLIHTGEKPHECDVCGTAFRRSGDMWKHKRTLHGIQGTNGDDNKSIIIL